MSGLDRNTALVMSPDAHLIQSLGDILSTPVGSRVMRRDYGSDLPRIIDRPMNGETLVDIFQATAEAIDLWEPRFIVERVEVVAATAGVLDMILTGTTDHGALSIDISVGVAA